MMPDLGRYAVEVTSAYIVSLGLNRGIGALVMWFAVAGCAASWMRSNRNEERMGKIRPLMLLPPLLFLGLAVMFYIGNFREGRNDLPSARAGQEAPALWRAATG